MTYRRAGEPARCPFCQGSDIHTFSCWAVAARQAPDPLPRQAVGARRRAAEETARYFGDQRDV